MEPFLMFLGLCLGVAVSAAIWGGAALPEATDNQFKKDCVSMAHGTIDKSASNVCVKNGKILFHK